jgi:uncharacterized membrane protein
VPVIIPVPGGGYDSPANSGTVGQPNGVQSPDQWPDQSPDQTTVSKSTSANAGAFMLLMIPVGLVLMVGAGCLIYYATRPRTAKPGSWEELSNDVVTVSYIQVALLAHQCPIQQQLTEIVETMPIDTAADHLEQIRAIVVALLRLPEFWSHAKAGSQTFPDRNAAAAYFGTYSMGERR